VTTLAHTCEAMASHVVKPRIAASLGCSPFDGDDAEEVAELGQALTWAARTAAGLHGMYADACNGEAA
jgi:hypothetical protein